jgi:hypothetical protein
VRPVGKIQEIREDWHQPDFSISCFFWVEAICFGNLILHYLTLFYEN